MIEKLEFSLDLLRALKSKAYVLTFSKCNANQLFDSETSTRQQKESTTIFESKNSKQEFELGWNDFLSFPLLK